MPFRTTLDTYFPNAVSEITFVAKTSDWLHELGFSAENCIVSLGRCRDELTLPLLQKLRTIWGSVFDLSALGGMLFAGKTGFSAAIAHAPTDVTRKRYLFFAFAHIGIDATDSIGLHLRVGQGDPSATCGALSALQQDLLRGDVDLALDPTDVEQSLLRQRLVPLIEEPDIDLASLTKLAEQAISADLQNMIDLIVNPEEEDYAIITGIHIHTPQHRNFVWVNNARATVQGVTHSL